MPISEVYNMDCMEYMKGIPDKFFDLAIVDPQYGIDIMHNDVPLKEEIFGKNFLQCYMYALDSKIKELQKEFDEL